MMGLPRRYAPRNDRKGMTKEIIKMDSRFHGNDISGRVLGEFYIFSILQRPIIYVM